MRNRSIFVIFLLDIILPAQQGAICREECESQKTQEEEREIDLFLIHTFSYHITSEDIDLTAGVLLITFMLTFLFYFSFVGQYNASEWVPKST